MARTFSLSASVGGSDISSLITGTTEVSREENQAATATLSFLPAPGAYNPEDWIGAAATIDYTTDPDGTPVTERLFTGNVNLPSLDDSSGVLTLSCSDLIQEDFEAMTDAQILAAIPGSLIADEVFGERDDGWQRAEDAMSTVRSDVHKSRAGALTVTDWAAKATADFSYTSSGYLDLSPRVTFSERREIVNTIGMLFEYRFNRHKIRQHSFAWGAGPNGGTARWTDWCQWFQNSHDLPTVDMIEQAASGTGWPLFGAISYEHHPPAGIYYCNGDPVGWLGVDVEDGENDNDAVAREEARLKIALSATWTGRRRWAQTITESFALVVSSPGSIALYGAIPGEDGASLETPSKDDAWESGSGGVDIPAGFAQDVIDDWVEDQDDRTSFANAVECLLQHADNKIAASHRRNYVEWQAPLEPTLELSHTAEITAGRVTAKGKIYQVGHRITESAAITTIKIACSRGGGGSSDALTAPEALDTEPTHGTPSAQTRLTNYIGGNSGVTDWDGESLEGESYISGNDSIITTALEDKIYPRRVQVVGPDIEEEARENIDAIGAPTYSVAVPNDTLTVTIT